MLSKMYVLCYNNKNIAFSKKCPVYDTDLLL